MNIERMQEFEALEIVKEVQVKERKNVHSCILVHEEYSIILQLIDKYSTLPRIERVLAYCLRYFHNLQKFVGD